jgi:HEAT repeat protein
MKQNTTEFSPEIQQILDGVLSEDSIEAISYAYELGDNPDKAQALKALIIALEKVEPEVKLVIIDILSQTDFFGDEIVLPLCARLSDSDAEVRAHAASAVANTKDPRAVDPLINALENETDADARYAQMNALAAIGDKKAIKPIQKWTNSDNWLDRFNAVDALGTLADDSSLPVMLRLLKDPHPKVRENAVLSCGYFENPEIRDRLLELLEDDDLSVVAAAIYMLGEFKASEAIPAFLDLLKCDDEEILILVLESLAKIRNNETVKYIIPLFNHPSPNVIKAVVEMLDLFNPADYFDALVEEILCDPKIEYLKKLFNDKNKVENMMGAIQKIEYPEWAVRLITLIMTKRKRSSQ